MSLERFVDCAMTMMYEEFQRVGHSVFEAFDHVRKWAAGGEPLTTTNGTTQTREKAEPMPDNDRSMQSFMAQLSSVGGMPG